MRCPFCGSEIEKDSLFCPVCGKKIEQPVSTGGEGEYCPFCGTFNEGDADFCCGCGKRLNEENLYTEFETYEEPSGRSGKGKIKVILIGVVAALAIALIGGGVYGLLTSDKDDEDDTRIEERQDSEDKGDEKKTEKETEEEKEAAEKKAEEEKKAAEEAEKAKKEEEEKKAEEERKKAEEEKKKEAEEYILPQSSTTALSSNDIKGLSLKELNYARNEIFARHGRKFASAELQNYFNSKSWYKGTIEPSDFDSNYMDTLSSTEKSNIELLKKEEYSRSSSGYKLDQ